VSKVLETTLLKIKSTRDNTIEDQRTRDDSIATLLKSKTSETAPEHWRSKTQVKTIESQSTRDNTVETQSTKGDNIEDPRNQRRLLMIQ
ncbi:2868_t:CDS:2, partial [Dentiscutata erythropus]